jgi:hypothetical protein
MIRRLDVGCQPSGCGSAPSSSRLWAHGPPRVRGGREGGGVPGVPTPDLNPGVLADDAGGTGGGSAVGASVGVGRGVLPDTVEKWLRTGPFSTTCPGSPGIIPRAAGVSPPGVRRGLRVAASGREKWSRNRTNCPRSSPSAASLGRSDSRRPSKYVANTLQMRCV